MVRLLSHCFTSDRCKVRTKEFVSVDNISVSNWTIFEKILAYQTLKVTLGRGANHTQEASSVGSLCNLLFGESLMVLPNCINVKSVIVSKEIRSPRIIMKVEGMEPLFGRSEFYNAPVHMHLKRLHRGQCYHM